MKKYHRTSYYHIQKDLQDEIEENGNESGDDDYIVSLPGEVDGCDSDIEDEESEGGSNKQPRIVGVQYHVQVG